MSEVPPPTRRARKVADDPSVVPGVTASGDDSVARAGTAGGRAADEGPAHGETSGDGPVPPPIADEQTGDRGPVAAGSVEAFDDDDHRLPTAQLERAAFGEHALPWTPPEPPLPPSVAPWALVVAVVALVASLFVGWTLPLGVIAVALAIVSLRRPTDSGSVAGWALALSIVSVIYSAGWLIWALPQVAVAPVG